MECELSKGLVTRVRKLKNLSKRKFNWDLEMAIFDPDQEDAPVIVGDELTPTEVV